MHSDYRFIVFFLLSFLTTDLLAQCELSQISAADTVCFNSEYTIQTSFNNASEVTINFSGFTPDVIDSTHVYTSIGGLFTGPSSVSIVKDGANYYGLVKDPNLTQVKKLTFGNSLLNLPTVSDLEIQTSASLTATSRGGFKFIRIEGIWHAVTTMNTARLVFLKFHNGLANDTVLGDVYFDNVHMNNSANCDIVTINDSIHIVVVAQTGLVGIFNFGDTLGTVYNAASSDVVSTGDLVNARSIAVVNDCGSFHVFVAGITRQKLCHLDYGSSLFSVPTYNVAASGVSVPVHLYKTYTEGRYQIWVKNRNTGVSKYDFTQGLSSAPVKTSYNPSASMSGDPHDQFFYDGRLVHLTFDNSINEFRLTTFQSDTVATINYAESDTATTIFHDTGGYWIMTEHSDQFKLKRFNNVFVYNASAPSAAFDFAGQCFGQVTEFTDQSTATDTIISWTWDFDGFGSSNLPNASHMFIDTGYFEVTLTVSNTLSCQDSISDSVYISGPPEVNFGLSLPCQSQDIEFSDSSIVFGIESIDSLVWIFDTLDTITDNTGSITKSFPDTGFVAISLIAITNFGCSASLDSSFSVNPSPIAGFSVDSTCFGDSTIFINQSTSIIPYNHFWSFGDGNTSILASPNHLYLDTGIYEVVYSATSNQQCSDTLQETIRVSNNPSYSFSVPLGSICTFSKRSFKASSTQNMDRVSSWIFGVDTTFSDSTIISPTNKTVTEIEYRSTVGTACTFDTVIDLTIIDGPFPRISALMTCLEETTELESATTPPIGQELTFFSWVVNNEFVGDADSIHLQFIDTGWQQIQFRVQTDSQCVSILDTQIFITPAPTVDFELFDPICTNIPIQVSSSFSVHSRDSILSVWWETPDTLFLPDSVPLSLESFGDSVPITLNLVTREQCSARDSKIISVNESPVPEIRFDTLCAGSIVEVSSGYSGSNYAHNWEIDSSAPISDASPEVVFKQPGEYGYVLEILDRLSGCMATDSGIIAAAGLAKSEILSKRICQGGIGTLELRDSTLFDKINSTVWNIDTQEYFGKAIEFVVPMQGTSEITVRLTTQRGCNESINVSLETNDPESIEPLITLDSSTVATQLILNDPDSTQSVFWTLDNVDTANNLSAVFDSLYEGDHLLTYHLYTSNDCYYSKEFSININTSKPKAIIEEITAIDQNNVTQLSIRIFNVGEIKISHLRIEYWAMGSERLSESFEVNLEPNSSVELTSSVRFPIDNGTIYCGNILASNNISQKESIVCTNDFTESSVGLPYPNPASSEQITLPIFSLEPGILEIEFMDITGKLFGNSTYEISNKTNLVSVQIDHLPAGTYLLKATGPKLSGSASIVIIR
ncbi:MAG: hypothetical protein Salg2KO_05710 [Salibacteraceae bacterium]